MKRQKRLLAIIFPIAILFSLCTVFQGWVPHWGLAIYASLFGSLFFFFIYVYSFFSNRQFICYLLFLIVAVFNVLLGDKYWSGSPFAFISSFVMMLICMMAAYYYLGKTGPRIFAERIIIVSLAVLVISAISTTLLSIAQPQIIRFAMEEFKETGNDTILKELYRLGMSNYYLPHAIPVIIPALVLCAKNNAKKWKERFLWLLLLFACFALIYASGATTSLLLGLIALIAAVVLSEDKKKNILRLSLIVLSSIPFLNEDFMVKTVRTMEDIVGEDSYFYMRLYDIENSITGEVNTGDVEVRSNIYGDSWDAFLESPLLGIDAEVGGHSIVLDILATMGVVGFVPFIFLLLSIYLWSKKRLPPDTRPYYFLGFFIGVLMLSLKSMNNMEMWFFLICLLPILISRYGVNKKSAVDIVV